MMWYYYGWDTWYKVYVQIWVMALHTLPLISALNNYMFLTDAPIYISDAWILVIVALSYNVTNYIYYHLTGETLYVFMDWSKPEYYWLIAVSAIFLLFLVIYSNTLIAVISQAIVGRFEWDGDWLKI